MILGYILTWTSSQNFKKRDINNYLNFNKINIYIFNKNFWDFWIGFHKVKFYMKNFGLQKIRNPYRIRVKRMLKIFTLKKVQKT